jgi:hypothetical protein
MNVVMYKIDKNKINLLETISKDQEFYLKEHLIKIQLKRNNN